MLPQIACAHAQLAGRLFKSSTLRGTQAGAPVGKFIADCTVVAGQNTTLATFTIEAGDVAPDLIPDIDLPEDAVDFGRVQSGVTEPRVVPVRNAGTGTLNISQISLAGADASAFMQTSDCSALAAGESCSVDVTFIASDPGARSATLTISSDDPDESAVSVALTAVSEIEPVADIELDAETLDFGSNIVDSPTDRSLTISNVGSADLNIANIALTSGDDFSIIGNDCGTLAPSASCVVTVRYAAAVAGNASTTLSITSDDSDEAVTTVSLTGEAKEDTTGGATLDLSFNVNGSTFVAASSNTLPLEGVIDSVLDLATGDLTASLMLEPTSGTFPVVKFFRRLTATAQVDFEPTGPTTDKFQNGQLTTTSEVIIKVPKVTASLWGLKLPLGGGPN